MWTPAVQTHVVQGQLYMIPVVGKFSVLILSSALNSHVLISIANNREKHIEADSHFLLSVGDGEGLRGH